VLISIYRWGYSNGFLTELEPPTECKLCKLLEACCTLSSTEMLLNLFLQVEDDFQDGQICC